MKKRLQILFASIIGLMMASNLVAQDHLLITEFVVTPTAGEFIEIYNPTDQAIDLSNYYLSDEIFNNNNNYIHIVEGGFSAFSSDYMAKFPAGATIASGQFITVAVSGAGFLSEYGKTADFEMKGDDATTPDMDPSSAIGGSAGLSNDGECIILFYWDGQSDLVQDVDIVVWGDQAEAVDKTGFKIDGPDADTDSTEYAADTPMANQFVVNTDNDGDGNPHDDGMSAQRRLEVEDVENWSANGNGLTGHDETGENTSYKGGIWSINEPPTPGWRALSPYPAADSLTVADVQFIRADSIGPNINDDSPFLNDTLTVTAVVMHGIREIFVGARWSVFLQDPRGGPWSGFFVVQNDSAVGATGFSAAEPGDLIRFTGLMSEFPSGPNTSSISQFALFTNPAVPVEILDVGTPLPDPILLTPGDLGLNAAGSSADPQLSERWESTLARFEGLTVVANPLSTGSNTMSAQDDNGDLIILDDYFNAVSNAVTANGNTWPGLPAGTRINVTGYVRNGTSSGNITINPATLDDIEVASVPPNVTNLVRDPVAPTSASGVTVSAQIIDADGTVASANLLYNVDSGAFQSVILETTDGTTYAGDIPAQADGALVQYFITSEDNEGNGTTLPSDTSAAKFFYFVRDGGLGITDLQFTPFANGNSGYAGSEVTVTGVVTSPKENFSGTFINSVFYLQDGTEKWSGIQVRAPNDSVGLGDNVTVTGTVVENFNVTRIDNVTSVVINSSGGTVPDPVVVPTGSIGTGGADAEAYESMLVEVRNVTVTTPFSDGGSNFGEFSVNDGSGEVRIDDESGHDYTQIDTMWAGGEQIEFIRGVQHFHNSNYKIQPRNDGDLGNIITAVGDDPIPFTFDLAQNYPNPFNPQTTIQYQLAKQGQVTITIYNLLGQKIRTLVDEVRPAGAYKIIWDGRGANGLSVSTGVYFYKMVTSDFVKINKMLLMK